MDADRLSTFASLHPRLDAERSLLWLELEHGKANEVGHDELEALESLCEAIESDDSVRCICTTSDRVSKRGTPLFIAGANVTQRAGWDNERVKAHVRKQRALMQRLRELPVFTLALTHGVTLGWGVEYLLTTDYNLATPSATLGLPETGLGIIPGARGSAELAALIGPAQAMRLGATGERIDGAEALRIGLVQELVEDLDQGRARVEALAKLVSMRSPTALAAFKAASLASRGSDKEARLETEALAYELCVDSGEAAIGREAFAKIRAGESPQWGPRRRRDAE